MNGEDRKDIFDGLTKDGSIPLNIPSLTKQQPTNHQQDKVTVGEETKALTPLEQMKEQRKTEGLGMQVTQKQLEDGAEKPLQDFSENEERMENIKKRVDEFDGTIDKRKHVVLIKQPTNPQEYAELISEIDSVVIKGDVATIDYRDSNDGPIDPIFIRLRTEQDPPFSMEADELLLKGEDSQEVAKMVEEGTVPDVESRKTSEVDEKTHKIVEILIDKTGLGANWDFTPEERQKMYEAQEIKLKEVKVIDINAWEGKPTGKSFQESITEYQLSSSSHTIPFPASGFKASMRGLTYGELSDIALDIETVDVQKYHKRMSIIYNHMFNVTTGPFRDFDDFLHRFSYLDIPLALLALYIATQPEIQQLQLNCLQNNCNKALDWVFSTRSLLKFKNCGRTFIEKFNEILQAAPSDYDTIRDRASVNVSKFIVMPESKIIFEVGPVSSYDFLYNFIPTMNGETLLDMLGEDVDEEYASNILLLTVIRSVKIPDKDGNYGNPATGFREIMEAVYRVTPTEAKVLSSIRDAYNDEMKVSFALENVKCPHCGTTWKELEINMDDVVFQTYQRLKITEIDVKSMLGF